MERERRKMRALKKENRKKELEEAKEEEKKKWLSFNAKATSRSMKVFFIHFLLFINEFSRYVSPVYFSLCLGILKPRERNLKINKV